MKTTSTTTGSVEYGAPSITPIVRFIVSTSTQPGEPVYNIKTYMPCTTI